MAKGGPLIMENHAANRWIENEPKHPLAHTHWAMNYLPAPLEKGDGTGIRELLVERLEGLFTSCGSGSWCDAAFSQLKERVTRDYFSGDWTVVFLNSDEEAEKALEAPTVVEKLTKIRDAFGLSMAALADIIRASRASVYNWFENETPSEGFVQRIEKLHEIAQEWKAANPYHYGPGKLMKQKLGDGASMHERLSREEPDINEIREGMKSLLALMNKQREMMDRAKARSAKTPSDSENHKELLERLTGSVSADK